MRREAGELENFFIAKNRDSESARDGFGRLRSASLPQVATSSSNARMSKTCAAQVFLAISMIVRVVISHAIRVVMRARYDVDEKHAQRLSASARQRFLKQDSVFSKCVGVFGM
jgi:hypothetical protein